jgi:hypothetical protein
MLSQKYVEALTPFVTGAEPDVSLVAAQERFRLAFLEYEGRFLEWHEGHEVINEGVAAFLDPDHFRRDENLFRMMLLLATRKFKDILKKATRDLTEMHEEIALVEGESKAEEITHVPSSAVAKIKEADAVVEIGRKWLGRVVKFAPWAYEVIKTIHL